MKYIFYQKEGRSPYVITATSNKKESTVLCKKNRDLYYFPCFRPKLSSSYKHHNAKTLLFDTSSWESLKRYLESSRTSATELSCGDNQLLITFPKKFHGRCSTGF